VIALDDETSMKSLEPLDAVADTISGPIANRLIGKVKKKWSLCFRARVSEQCR